MNPIENFKSTMQQAGYELTEPPIPDGKLHRFSHNDRNGGRCGWYVLHIDGIPAGSFGDWRSGQAFTWCSKKESDFTPLEREQFRQRIEQQKRARQAEEQRTRDKAAKQARHLWDTAQPADPGHPYLKKKQIKPYDMRQDKSGRLLIPVRNSSGDLRSLQTIDADGQKRFLFGGQKKGCYHFIEGAGDTLFFAEGIATGASIHKATKAPVYICFDAGNLKPVAEAIRTKQPGARIVICADDDKWEEGNPGLTKAAEAAVSVKGEMVCPTFKDLSSKPTDFNDLAVLQGIDEVKKQLLSIDKPVEDIFSKPADISHFLQEQPSKIRFFAKDRIPQGRGILITGIGGSSKTRLLYHLAIGAVIGRLPWAWEIEQTGKAVLCLTEDTEEDVHRTLYFLARRFSLSIEQKQALAENLIIYPLAGKDFRLLTRTPAGTVEKSPLYHALAKKIIDTGNVAFVGIDPALSVSEGDEMDQGHQRALGKMVDDLAIQTGATCALASHATKASLGTKKLTSHNSRGGGAITDAVRAEYSMRNMTADESGKAGIDDPEERKRHVQLVATKGNALPPSAFVPIWLRRDDSGSLFEADVVFESGNRGPGEKDMAALDVLKGLSVNNTPALADWRAECITRGIIAGQSPEAQVKAMQRITRKLSAAGLIKKGIGKGVYLPGGDDDF